MQNTVQKTEGDTESVKLERSRQICGLICTETKAQIIFSPLLNYLLSLIILLIKLFKAVTAFPVTQHNSSK